MHLSPDTQAFMDRELARRVLLTFHVYLLLTGLIAITTPYATDHPRIFLIFSALVVLVFIVRLPALMAAYKQNGFSSKKTLQQVYIGIPIAGGVWGIFSTVTLSLYGLTWTGMLFMLCSCGIVGAAAAAIFLHQLPARAYLVATILPPTIWGAVNGTRESIAFSIFFTIYGFLMASLIRFLNRDYCQLVRTRQPLAAQQTEPETVNNRLRSEIKHRDQCHRTIEENEAIYRTIVDNTPEGLVIIQDMDVVYTNRQLLDILGYSDDETIGRPFIDAFSRQTREKIKNRYQSHNKTIDLPPNMRLSLPRKTGETIQAEINSAQITHEGKPATMMVVRDITEQHQTLKALEASRAKYRGILESIDDGYFEINPMGDLFFFNDALARIMGYSRGELKGMNYRSYTDPINTKKLSEIFTQVLVSNQTTRDMDIDILRKDGTRVLVAVSTSLIMDPKTGIRGFRGIMRDVTARKLTENWLKQSNRALKESEERYRALFEGNPIATIIVNREGKVISINPTKGKSPDRNPQIGDIMYRDYASRHAIDMHAKLMACMEEGRPAEFPELKYKDKYLQIWIAPFSEGAIISSIDITRRKQAEDQIHDLTQELIKAQENERQRIARDLHDNVAQDLASLTLSCQTLFDTEPVTSPLTRKRFDTFSATLKSAIRSIRDLAYNLQPPNLDQLGLSQAIYRYCEDFSVMSQIHVDFNSAGMEQLELDFEAEINLYRIVQEAMNNVRKHAKASEVTVRLVAAYPELILRVEDNGEGFDVDKRMESAKEQKCMGLRSMRERVDLLRGMLRIDSCPGKGSRIVVTIPFAAQARRRQKAS